MTCLEWSRQLTALRQGELRLLEPGDDGLSQVARRSLDDFREYIKALENGYRAVCRELDERRRKERVGAIFCGRKTLRELTQNQWSEGAALGYAAMALIQSGITPDGTVAVLELMEDLMREFDLDYAAEFQQGLKEGRQGAVPTDGETDSSTSLRMTGGENGGPSGQARTAPGPRWGPAEGAEGLCTEAQAKPLAASAPTGNGEDEEPTCESCGALRDKVIDDFAVDYCPYLASPILNVKQRACEQYYYNKALEKRAKT